MGRKLRIQKAIHIGRSHILNYVNRQDVLTLFNGQIHEQHVVIGIICDGCSEGVASEMGAHLACDYLVRKSVNLLTQNVATKTIPRILYEELLEYMDGVLRKTPFKNLSDNIIFIKDHLLFSVIGFIATESELMIFVAGDGIFIINDYTNLIDADDKALYPAYHLLDRSVLDVSASTLPENFDVYVYDLHSIKRWAIGSDAWLQERELLDHIWGFKHPVGLQRRINQWSRIDKRFKDDVSIITVEVYETSEEDDNASSH
jgi:hypothetical protein